MRSGSLLLCLICLTGGLTGFVSADDTGILTIGDISIEDGLVSTGITLAPPDDVTEPVYVALYTRPSADCGLSRFFTWVLIPPSFFGKEIVVRAPVTEGIVAKELFMVAVAEIDNLPAPCAEPAVISEPFTVPGEIQPNLNVSFTAIPGDTAGPEFRVDNLAFIDLTSRVHRGDSLICRMEVTNTGSADTTNAPVQVNGYLGTREVPPAVGTFTPPAPGMSTTATLRYTVPLDLSYRSYPLTLIIDPFAVHSGSPEGKVKRVPGLVNLADPGTLSLAGECTNCWT